jgi:hypothetical protein
VRFAIRFGFFAGSTTTIAGSEVLSLAPSCANAWLGAAAHSSPAAALPVTSAATRCRSRRFFLPGRTAAAGLAPNRDAKMQNDIGPPICRDRILHCDGKPCAAAEYSGANVCAHLEFV